MEEVSSDFYTYPDAFHVMSDTIGGNTLVIGRFEHKVVSTLVNEALSELPDLLLEFLGQKDLMRESGEREVKVIGELAV